MIRWTKPVLTAVSAAIVVILGIAMLQTPATTFAATNVSGGFEMRVCLDRTLSSNSTRAGDKFIATVVDPGPFNRARISGHVQSIRQSEQFKGATVMYLSFDRIRFSDREGYPINAEIVKLYDVPSGEQVDATHMIDARGRGAQMLKRTSIGALAGGVFSPTLGQREDNSIRPRLADDVGAGIIACCGHKELVLDQSVEMLLRVYHNGSRGYSSTVATKPESIRYPSFSLASIAYFVSAISPKEPLPRLQRDC
jgi:hypothetical protein